LDHSDLIYILIAAVIALGVGFAATRVPRLARRLVGKREEIAAMATVGDEVGYFLVTIVGKDHRRIAHALRAAPDSFGSDTMGSPCLRNVVFQAARKAGGTPSTFEEALRTELDALGFELQSVVTLMRVPNDDAARRRAARSVHNTQYRGSAAVIACDGLELWLDAQTKHGAWSINGVPSSEITPKTVIRTYPASGEKENIHFEDL